MIGFLFGLTVGWFLGIASVFGAVAWIYRKGVGGC